MKHFLFALVLVRVISHPAVVVTQGEDEQEARGYRISKCISLPNHEFRCQFDFKYLPRPEPVRSDANDMWRYDR